MRIAIVGSRDWPELEEVWNVVKGLAHDTLPEDEYALVPDGPHVIISGGAKGVDQAAAQAAREYGLEVVVHYPKWRDKSGVYNRAAGFERNQVIVDDCDMVIAFWDGKSRGTKDTMERARRAGKPVLSTRPF